jgi:peptide/nickel transport system permease protein
MIKLLLRKCLQGLMMILIVSAVTLALLSFAGGDALTQLRDNPQVSPETIERLRSVYGLDQPVTIRYFRWLSGAFDQYISARDRRLCNRTHVRRAAKPHRCAV